MALAMVREAFSATASGRLIATETRKPANTVISVASACTSTCLRICQVSAQMALGLGSRYPGTAKTRQAISQNMTRTAITTTGSQISCVRRSSDGRRRTGARVVATAGSGCTGAPPAENEFADARGAFVERSEEHTYELQ